ncbi:MAG: 5'-3' exonuclease H3TH domain-containing protein [Propionibacteriaceae bacterium]|nr:5'-3' exonuclease H3TH domain-containing protein [Propionibacteriaceae bacterium]
MTRTILALDGNSVLHRSFHSGARTGYRTDDGRPGWAVRGLLDQLVAAADRACADVVVVGFDDPDASTRRERWPDYKAQRPDKPDTLVSQVADAAALLPDMGIPVVIPTGLEADDVLAAASRTARDHGWRSVLATSDRDAFALIDDATRVLRIINGGVEASPMLTPERLQLLTGVTPQQYRDLAALRGDPSDNLPGVRGIGKIVGARLLAEFGTAEALFDDIDAGGERCRSCAGPAITQRLSTPEARERWAHNRRIMAPDPTATIPDEVLGTCLPLSSHPVRAGFRRYGLSYRQAVSVLCDEHAPTPHPWDTNPTWQPPTPAIKRFPPLPRKPQILQETLF